MECNVIKPFYASTYAIDVTRAEALFSGCLAYVCPSTNITVNMHMGEGILRHACDQQL